MARLLSTAKKKETSIELHPLVENAYSFFHSQSFLFDKVNLGLNVLESLQSEQIFSVIRSDDKYLLISGFETLGFSIESFDFRDRILIVYDNLSDKEIEEKAWSGVFKILLSSMQENQLEPFRNSLNNSAPEFIIKKLFLSKKLTQKSLSECTPISISGLKKQKKRATSLILHQSQTDADTTQKSLLENIFEAILNVAKNHKK
ncbi:hypothetical protein MT391_07625 [Vibrio sp. 1-Bac 57]